MKILAFFNKNRPRFFIFHDSNQNLSGKSIVIFLLFFILSILISCYFFCCLSCSILPDPPLSCRVVPCYLVNPCHYSTSLSFESRKSRTISMRVGFVIMIEKSSSISGVDNRIQPSLSYFPILAGLSIRTPSAS
jgi:hypothetical protein